MDWWRSATSDWCKFRQLSRGERVLLCQALLVLPLMTFLLAILGLRRVESLLRRLSPDDTERRPGRNRAEQAVRSVERAARRGLYQAPCLPRSLTLWWLLRRDGIATDLKIGVSRKGGALEAHAWVELGGRPLNDTCDVHERFAPLQERRAHPELT